MTAHLLHKDRPLFRASSLEETWAICPFNSEGIQRPILQKLRIPEYNHNRYWHSPLHLPCWKKEEVKNEVKTARTSVLERKNKPKQNTNQQFSKSMKKAHVNNSDT